MTMRMIGILGAAGFAGVAAAANPEAAIQLRQRIDLERPPMVSPEPLTINPIPMIVAGDPNGAPPDNPSLRIDPNVASSPFRGVCSLLINGAGLCTGTPISPRHILTAAHCFDFNNDGNNESGTNVRVTFNTAANQDTVIFSSGVEAVDLHPDFTGFANPALNDDMAIITLSNPIPENIPVYPVFVGPVADGELITAVGYGTTGDGVNGFLNNTASLTTKRTGQNRADSFASNDEIGAAIEVFEFDFDGPSGSSNCDEFGIDLTLGNNIETTLGGGDSGGPSFVSIGGESPEAEDLRVWGVNTFGGGCSNFIGPPLFGSTGGGIVTSGYFGWFIDFVPPSPFSLDSPANGATGQPTDVTLQWSRADFATSYNLTIATNSSLSNVVLQETGLTELEFDVPPGTLAGGEEFFWTVEAVNDNGAIDPNPFLFFSFATGMTTDLNGDGKVDGSDLGLLLLSWGTAGSQSGADFDNSGVVDGADLGMLLLSWTN